MTNLWVEPFKHIENCSYPIFKKVLPDYHLFYTPGILVIATAIYAREIEVQALQKKPSLPIVARLKHQAMISKNAWAEKYLHQQYRPLCLTLYTSQKCNLRCSYCFSQDAETNEEPDLLQESIKQAAEIVAGNCKRTGVDFTLALHGGGEPTQDARLEEILDSITAVTRQYGIGLFRYIATNGVMSEQKANWLTENFDRIGLSCDGPADIHLKQRPLKNGENSLPFVLKTAKIIKKSGIPLSIRVTITRDTLKKMPEIAAFLCNELGADEIRVEPAYHGGRNPESKNIYLNPSQAEMYCEYFLQARAVARSLGVKWQASGARLNELHFRNCQVFRDVLHLLPGGRTTACFQVSASKEAEKSGFSIEKASGDIFQLDAVKIGSLQKLLSEEDEKCKNCFLQFHCDRACPEMCPVKGAQEDDALRCRINQMLSTAILQEKAKEGYALLRERPIVAVNIDEKVFL